MREARKPKTRGKEERKGWGNATKPRTREIIGSLKPTDEAKLITPVEKVIKFKLNDGFKVSFPWLPNNYFIKRNIKEDKCAQDALSTLFCKNFSWSITLLIK